MTKKEIKFFVTNFLKGLIWVAIIIGIVLGLKKLNIFDFENFLMPFYKKPFFIFIIFIFSEIIFGIIPPELFMLWATHYQNIFIYAGIIITFATLSYMAGIIGFYIGKYLNTTIIFRYIRRRFLKSIEKLFYEYGMFLIIISAMTPIPFSGTSMFVGSSSYSIKKYLIFSLSRYLKFILYGFIIWQANASL